MDVENIQGHPRSFIASYAKDIITALIKGSKATWETEKEMMTEWTFYADTIYDWVMQDVLAPMTDAQYEFIENLMHARGFTDDMINSVKSKAMKSNISEASQLIEQLLIEDLPPEYKGWHKNKVEALEAIRNLVNKDGAH